MTHKLKLQKEYAAPVLNGQKTFEIRFDDRGYQKGDFIEFNVVDGSLEINHPLNGKTFVITYVLHGWGLKENWCALAIKEATTKVTYNSEEGEYFNEIRGVKNDKTN